MNEMADIDDPAVVDELSALQGVSIRKSKKGRVLSVDLTASAKLIDDQTASKLSRLPRLKTVILADSQITDEVIPELVKLQRLETLDLENTSITDQYADLFLNCEKLVLLSLTGTKITREKVAALRKKMIGTRIVFRT